MRSSVILEQIFPSRFEAVRALRAPASANDTSRLQSAAEAIRRAATTHGRAPALESWETFAEAIEIVKLLVEWRHGVVTATSDPERFLRAARVRLKELRGRDRTDAFSIRSLEALRAIEGDFEVGEVAAMRLEIASIPLPLAIHAEPEPVRPEFADPSAGRKTFVDSELNVAFLEFSIDGQIAEQVHWLRPRETHDLDIAVRVSRWPEESRTLILSPISIEPSSSYDLPVFAFDRPGTEPPYLCRQRGRMILHSSQSLRARPFEFMYTAEFHPPSTEHRVSIAGHRTLRLDGSDTDRQPITGYPGIDGKLIQLRNQLRGDPFVSETDLDDLLQVLVPLGSLMGQAVQDAIFPVVLTESEFEHRIREFLRQSPLVGVRLEEQARAAGGRTDLSFGGIRIELKSEPRATVLPADCERFARQAASYAVGTNRRVAVLCVLDCSPKRTVPSPAEDGLAVLPIESGNSLIYVVTCIVQGNLAKPSTLSR